MLKDYKYAAIVEHDSGETTGAIVMATNEMEAWGKLLAAFGQGRNIQNIRLAMVLTDERGRL